MIFRPQKLQQMIYINLLNLRIKRGSKSRSEKKKLQLVFLHLKLILQKEEKEEPTSERRINNEQK